MPPPTILNHDDFNRLSGAMFDNTYNSDSADVLRNEIDIANSQGDVGAAAAAQRDLKRVGTKMPGTSSSSTSSTSGTSSTSNPGDPTGSNIPEARVALDQFTRLSPDLEAALFSSDTDRANNVAAGNTAYLASATARAKADQLGVESDLATDDMHRQLLHAVGLDINDPASSLNREIQRQADTRTQREDVDKQITDLSQTSFFQNPFTFIANQPKIGALTEQYNNLARVENSSSEEINRLQSIAQSVMQLTPAKNADLLRQKSVLDAQATVEAAKAKAAEYSAANSAGHAKTLLDAFTARHNVFQSILSVNQLEENIADRRQRSSDTNFFKQQSLDDRRDKEAQKLQDSQRETALVLGINTYRKAINGSAALDLTPEDVKRMPTELRNSWYETILRGNYGNTYSDAIPFIQRFGNPAAAAQAGNAGMMQIVRNIDQRAQLLAPEIMNKAKLANPMASVKPQQALEMAYQELYSRDSGSAQPGADKSVVTGASPYAIDYDAAAAVSKVKPVGVVANSLVVAKDRAPGRSLNSTYTAPMLLNEVQARVINGEATPKDAAMEIARFFAVQSSASYETNGLRYLALPQAIDWTISPGGAGKQQLDLMNPVKVENYLTSQVAKARSNSAVQFNDATGSSNIFSPDPTTLPPIKKGGVK